MRRGERLIGVTAASVGVAVGIGIVVARAGEVRFLPVAIVAVVAGAMALLRPVVVPERTDTRIATGAVAVLAMGIGAVLVDAPAEAGEAGPVGQVGASTTSAPSTTTTTAPPPSPTTTTVPTRALLVADDVSFALLDLLPGYTEGFEERRYTFNVLPPILMPPDVDGLVRVDRAMADSGFTRGHTRIWSTADATRFLDITVWELRDDTAAAAVLDALAARFPSRTGALAVPEVPGSVAYTRSLTFDLRVPHGQEVLFRRGRLVFAVLLRWAQSPPDTDELRRLAAAQHAHVL